MDVTAKLEGAKEFSNLLKKLPAEMERSAVQTGLQGAARVVKKKVQEKAPVYQGKGHPTRTTPMWGNAGSNVTIMPGTLKRSIVIRKDKKQKLGILVGPGRAFYAHFLEWGTKAHKIIATGNRYNVRWPKWMKPSERAERSRKFPRMLADYTTGKFFGKEVRHPGSRKRPFLVPALDSSKQEMIAAFGKSLATGIDREANKLIGKYKVRRK